MQTFSLYQGLVYLFTENHFSYHEKRPKFENKRYCLHFPIVMFDHCWPCKDTNDQQLKIGFYMRENLVFLITTPR